MTSQRQPGRGSRGDANAGRRLSIAVEALGECITAAPTLPPALLRQAELMANGRSTVPADGSERDFPTAVREALSAEAPAAQEATALAAWLGAALTAWLNAALTTVPRPPWALALVDATALAREARDDLLTRKRPIADVYARWHGEGLDAHAGRVFACASTLALGEAVDRWVALGCEGSLDRYTVTWQRASSGWAESVLGTAVDVPVSDLGNLRALQSAMRALRREKVPAKSLPKALAAKLDLPAAEVERLLALQATVRDRLDPERLLKRRWALVKPIAVAVSSLEKELGRLPSVSEIAERADVHEAAVELVLESLGDD